jgi:S1-C subfamily serine protease
MSFSQFHKKSVVFLFLAASLWSQDNPQWIRPELAEKMKVLRLAAVSVRCVSRSDHQPCSHVGSGFVWNSDGLILTRSRVVGSSDLIEITLPDGRSAKAQIVGDDLRLHLTLLKIPIGKLAALTPGSADSLKRGSPLVVIGNSLGVFPSVAIGTFLDIRDDGLMEMDLHVPPGNCGSPVLDENGRLVGIWIGQNSLESCDTEGGLRPGLAMPIEKIGPAVQRMLEPHNGWVGISVVDLDHEHFGKGVRVVAVTPESPAAKASIAPGDTLVAFNNMRVESAVALARWVKQSKPASKVVFIISKGGEDIFHPISIQAAP